MKHLVTLSRFFLAALFLFAAGAKIATRNDVMESYFTNVPMLMEQIFHQPETVGLMIAWLVIVVEVVAAALLLSLHTMRVGAALVGVMLVGFALFALYYRYGLGHEQGLECGCFGGLIKSQLGVSTAIRNLLLLVPVAVLLRPAWTHNGERQGLPTNDGLAPCL
jgi:uncharacterized membrane protein YphA (DoxX/SURF4 family)